MLKLKSSIFAAAAATLLLASCGQSKNGSSSVSYGYELEDAMHEAEMPMMKSRNASLNETSLNSEAVAQRKLILNGNAGIEVPSISGLDIKIDEWAKNFGGYVANSDWSERNFYATVKIPSSRFYDAMNSTSDFGKIKNHNINTNDVTDEYFDLESRIETKKILRNSKRKKRPSLAEGGFIVPSYGGGNATSYKPTGNWIGGSAAVSSDKEDKDKWKNEFDWLYNLLEDIAELNINNIEDFLKKNNKLENITNNHQTKNIKKTDTKEAKKTATASEL